MKKVILTALCVLALSSVGFASPLMDYSKGSASLDINYRPSLDAKCGVGIDNSEFSDYVLDPLTAEFDGKSWEWAGTVGIGNNFALQYRQLNASTDFESIKGLPQNEGPEPQVMALEFGGDYDFIFDKKVKAEEFNVLYKVDKNVAAFVGVVKAKEHLRLGVAGDGNHIVLPEISSHGKTMAQVGLVGNVEIADKTNAYGIVSFGSDYRNWEVGLSYEFAKDTEFNVNYRDTKFDKMTFADIRLNGTNYDVNAKDVTLKGFGFGLTFKM